jgi:hypothetical protein
LNGSDDEEDEDEDLEARIIRDRTRVQSEQNIKGGESATGAWAENEKARKRIGKRLPSSVDTSTNGHIVIHYTDTPCREFSKLEAAVG